ncbi:hypothetical protein A3842_07885 [Paenibacillus sp. P3E]|uniref:S-layer homology domain-containing protein n=1 Tax=Paenibacillus sp. P3E TaxID=1349435 RepID=UPI00093D2CDC|nr:S-layer homology domain-containing protein [Paenibacillus sp. P3E]OKP84762.1 hypothetical protein A3842_07885 [Paenibacillus sp. P3E]
MKKSIISTLSALILISATPALAASSFSDVPESNWAAPAITFMVDKQAVSGYADGTFKPGKPVTKAEFIHMFHTLLPNIGGTANNPPNFVDLKGNWAAKDFNAVFGAHGWELTDHFSSDYKKAYLAPDKQLTRWDVAIITGVLTMDTLFSDTQSNSVDEPKKVLDTIGQFKDIKKRPAVGLEMAGMYTPVILTEDYGNGDSYAGDAENIKALAIYTVISNDIMGGANGKFRPTDKVTRAEAVTILQRVYTASENK